MNRKFRNLGVWQFLPRCYCAERHGRGHQPFQASGLTCLVPLILYHYHHRLVLSRSLALPYSYIYPQHSLDMISQQLHCMSRGFPGRRPKSDHLSAWLTPPSTTDSAHSPSPLLRHARLFIARKTMHVSSSCFCTKNVGNYTCCETVHDHTENSLVEYQKSVGVHPQ